MGIQSWVASKLSENNLDVQAVGSHGLLVTGSGQRSALVAVAEPDPNAFERDDLDATLAEYEGCEMIVMVKRAVGAGVFEAAGSRSVLIGPLGHLIRALKNDGPLADFRHSDDEYLESRMRHHRNVTGVTRVGTDAWQINRTAPLAPLTIARQKNYEFPVADFHSALAAHPGIRLDAIVATNPNTKGVSARTTRAGEEAGIAIFLFEDFLARLAQP